jgi:hypothetical protein
MTVVFDRRLDEAFSAASAAGSFGPELLPLATERRHRLIALARQVLDAPPAETRSEPALARGVIRNQLALRIARDGELWAVLVGDATELAAARARVDEAAATAHGSQHRLRDAVGHDLPCTPEAEQVEPQAVTGRRNLDTILHDRVNAARSIMLVSLSEACVVESAGDLLDSPSDWYHLQAVMALSDSVSRLNHAAALALLRSPDAPPGGPVEAAEIRMVLDRVLVADEQFMERADGDLIVRYRDRGRDGPVRDLVGNAAEGTALPASQPSWREYRDEILRHLQSTSGAVLDLAP